MRQHKIWLKGVPHPFFQAVVDFSADEQALKAAVTGLCVSAISAGVAAAMNLKEE